MLQKNLQVIDQAIAESRAALRSEPQSAPARDSLFDALKRSLKAEGGSAAAKAKEGEQAAPARRRVAGKKSAPAARRRKSA